MKNIKDAIPLIEVIINASLDAYCIVDKDTSILHSNFLMKSLLGLKPKDFQSKRKFSTLLELTENRSGCVVEKAIKKDDPIRFDETPATIGGKKFRLSIKITPFKDPDGDKKSPALGAIIMLRDTTAELLTQAKYHKVAEQVAELEEQVVKYKDMLVRLRANYGR